MENASEEHGVGLLIKKELLNRIDTIRPVNSRLMKVSLKGNVKTNIAINYSPYSPQKSETESHYEKLQGILGEIPKREFTCILGDFNCELAKKNT